MSNSMQAPSLCRRYESMWECHHVASSSLRVQLVNPVPWLCRFLYFFGAVFNLAGMCAVATVGRQPLSSMFSGLSTVGPTPAAPLK
jgi:hypothetical protein